MMTIVGIVGMPSKRIASAQEVERFCRESVIFVLKGAATGFFTALVVIVTSHFDLRLQTIGAFDRIWTSTLGGATGAIIIVVVKWFFL